MKSFAAAVMLSVLAMSVAAAGEPSIQKGEPPVVEARSTVPPDTIGAVMLTQCGQLVAIEFVIVSKDGPGLITVSVKDSPPDVIAPMVEELTFILKAGGPVHKIELDTKCQRT